MRVLWATLGRNRFGALLIVAQVALTLAIVGNAASVVRAQLKNMAQSSGLDEANVFSLNNRWVGPVTDATARVARDLALLRAVPGVVDAVSTNGVPLSGRGWGTAIDRQPVSNDRMARAPRASLYYFDEHGAAALGLELSAGRWFSAGELDTVGQPDNPPVALLTQSLARQLFPAGDALGGQIYLYAPVPVTVIGIVRTLKGPDARTINGVSNGNAVLLPQRLAQSAVNNYIVRAQPGQLLSVMHEAERRLRAEQPLRAITELRSFEETRSNGFRRFRALAVVLVAISALLLIVTSLGIVGLTTYWVTQRRRAIGVRRALGARRGDIVGQFQLETAVIAGLGILSGVALTLVLNVWLAMRLGVPRLSAAEIIGGGVVVLLLMQFAALWPALRAAMVPPTLATRSA